MSNPVKLTINRQTKGLVVFNGSAATLPDVFKNNSQDYQIQFVDPDPSGAIGRYVAADMSAVGLRVSLGSTPSGTPLTFQDTWTWDTANQWFTASLPLNVAAVNTALTSDSLAVYLELNATTGNRATLFQGALTLRKVIDDGSTVAPTPVDQYLTKAECLALLAKLIGDAGQVIVLKSPNGVYGRELGVADDGTAIDDVITL